MQVPIVNRHAPLVTSILAPSLKRSGELANLLLPELLRTGDK